MSKQRLLWLLALTLGLALSFVACEDDAPSGPTPGSSNGDGTTTKPPPGGNGGDGKYNVGKLGGTVWSQYADPMDWWYKKPDGTGGMDGIEEIIPRSRSYANSWIFNPDGTFVHTHRWLYYLHYVQQGGVLVIHGNYDVISDSQFKVSNVKTNTTTGSYYGTLTGWYASSDFICDYRFDTDSEGERIEVSMRATGQDYPNVEVDSWKPFWKRAY